ncbi:MAG: sugar isomerase domain-containing protein [Thermaerobacter sp.]|nr:sugar isomerase domain-containing protein [Thermaerobacter sp.]
MLAQQYLDAIQRIAGDLGDDLPQLAALGDQIAGRILDGGVFYVYDNGHLLTSELFNRAGGLALMAPIHLTRPRFGSDAVRRGGEPAAGSADVVAAEEDLVLARMAVQHAGVRSGDVVLLGSVSGRSPLVVEMAREAARRGALTIALTALAYARTLPPAHPSGQRLDNAVDVVLDNHTTVGDAEVDVPGLAEKLLPSSGVSAALVAWCLVGEVVEHLLTRGIEPTVFRSINYPDGPERYRAAVARYRERGY